MYWQARLALDSTKSRLRTGGVALTEFLLWMVVLMAGSLLLLVGAVCFLSSSAVVQSRTLFKFWRTRISAVMERVLRL